MISIKIKTTGFNNDLTIVHVISCLFPSDWMLYIQPNWGEWLINIQPWPKKLAIWVNSHKTYTVGFLAKSFPWRLSLPISGCFPWFHCWIIPLLLKSSPFPALFAQHQDLGGAFGMGAVGGGLENDVNGRKWWLVKDPIFMTSMKNNHVGMVKW